MPVYNLEDTKYMGPKYVWEHNGISYAFNAPKRVTEEVSSYREKVRLYKERVEHEEEVMRKLTELSNQLAIREAAKVSQFDIKTEPVADESLSQVDKKRYRYEITKTSTGEPIVKKEDGQAKSVWINILDIGPGLYELFIEEIKEDDA